MLINKYNDYIIIYLNLFIFCLKFFVYFKEWNFEDVLNLNISINFFSWMLDDIYFDKMGSFLI